MSIRTAILGYGRSGSSMHAGAIAANPPFELVAVCDIDPQRQQQARERFGCTIYDDYHAMLRQERLDLVCVITRSDQHCQMACDCLAAGVNVLVTKPWAVNEAEARRLVAASEATDKVLLPWLPSRWGTDTRRLTQLVAEGAIGDVFMIRRAVCNFSTRNDWQMERKHGGGYLLNWGAHIVDPPLQVVGSPVKSVYGKLRRTINTFGDAEDDFLGVLTTAAGQTVIVEHTTAAVNLPSWFVQGTRGTIEVRGRQLVMTQKTPPQPADPTQSYSARSKEATVTEETLGPALYGDEAEIYAQIAAALQGGKPYPVKPADALELSRIWDAIRRSSEEETVVRLTP